MAPSKLIQPILYYRFCNDLIILDNLNSWGAKDYIYQLDLQLSDKNVSNVSISNKVEIFLEDKQNFNYTSIELFISRLNSLGNRDAHDLANLFQCLSLKKHKPTIENQQINEEILIKNKDFLLTNAYDLLLEEEKPNYQKWLLQSQEEMKTNEENYIWNFQKVFYKVEPFKHKGYFTKKIEFNSKFATLIKDKKIENFDYADVLDLLHFAYNKPSDYFNYYKQILSVFLSDSIYKFNDKIKTDEDFILPCLKKTKCLNFVGKYYEEAHYFGTFEISEEALENLKKHREQKHIEELHTQNLQKAKLLTKFKRNKNFYSDSWKEICLLYYGNKTTDENVEHEQDSDKKNELFWKNVDLSKVCKYRFIDKKE